jgi:hypothetical protein
VVEYHKWRASTVKQFQYKTDVMSLRLKDIDSDAFGRHPRGHLRILISESGRNKNKGMGRDLCAAKLEDIIIDAVSMDLLMRMQRPVLSFIVSKLYDSNIMKMEVLDGERGEYSMDSHNVGLIVRPALIMQGNWDGEKYDEPPVTLVHSAVLPLSAVLRGRQRPDYTSDSASVNSKRGNSRTRKWK